MAQIVFGGAMSHSPMMNYPIPKNHDQVERFKIAVGQMAARLRDAKPDVVVAFGPDHFRALFYDLMPAFTVGMDRISGWGDWNTPAGPFSPHRELAKHIVETALAEGFDPAFSYELKVDHGITQPLELLNLMHLPIVPVVINCAGTPLPTTPRCHQFGQVVRQAIAAFPEDLRVAIIASGGLSHDPPIPSFENALHGRSNGFAGSRDRETKLIDNADKLKSRINPDWDHRALHCFEHRKAGEIAGELTTRSIFEAAGNGAQEIRAWLAMAGALDDAPMQTLCYEPIDALITGMAVIST